MTKLLVRLAIALVFAIFGLVNYFTNVSENPITGEAQQIALSPQQEIVIGQEGRQEIVSQFGGLYGNDPLQNYIDRVGDRVVSESKAARSPYPFEFHLLDAPDIINAFALPGGQIFITTAMLDRLDTEAQLAGILGHEIAHVVARHGAEHLAKQQLGGILVGAITIAASDEDNPDRARQAALITRAVNTLVNLKYSREDELESDRLGFQFMTEAGYNPEGIVQLMEILNSTRSGAQPPEFLSTHPNPKNRIDRLQALIDRTYPNGIPLPLEEGEENFDRAVPPQLN